MHDERTQAALGRIEAALARIGAVADNAGDARQGAQELARLRAAHALLRNRVETAISEIDGMLAPGREADG